MYAPIDGCLNQRFDRWEKAIAISKARLPAQGHDGFE